MPPPNDPYNIHSEINTEITKYAINAMLNAKGIVSAHKDFDDKSCGLTWKEFISLLEKTHKPLIDKGLWNTGYGLKLQFQDSQIAEKIMLNFIKQGIPCLPIHDSFIVPSEYKDELKTVMLSIYEERFNQSIVVK